MRPLGRPEHNEEVISATVEIFRGSMTDPETEEFGFSDEQLLRLAAAAALFQTGMPINKVNGDKVAEVASKVIPPKSD